jgi:hypothetical protein
MITKMYTVHDVTVEAFLPPFCVRNDAEAIRAVVDTSRNPDHVFHTRPFEYVLFYLGTFDDSTGHIEPVLSPVSLGNLKALQDQTVRDAQRREGPAKPLSEVVG